MNPNSSKIRAYQLDKLGSLDGLVLAPRDMPSVSAGEVLLRVRASSLNARDLMILNGVYPAPVPPGRVPLSDGASEVVAIGAGVKRFKVGVDDPTWKVLPVGIFLRAGCYVANRYLASARTIQPRAFGRKNHAVAVE